MLKRPKPGEDEDDILRMQEEYLKEKSTNSTLQPAAKVVNLQSSSKDSVTNYSINVNNTAKKPSKYAQAKDLKNNSEKRVRFNVATPSIVGDIVEKNSEQDDDKVYYPKVIPSVLGDIVEKNIDNSFSNFKQALMPSTGFPVVVKCDMNNTSEERSIYSMNLEKQSILSSLSSISLDLPAVKNNLVSSDMVVSKTLNIPGKSYIVHSNDRDQIHKENVEVLSKMSEPEILQEQSKLLESLDPALIAFVKSKRSNFKKQPDETQSKMDIEECSHYDKTDTSAGIGNIAEHDSLWENDVLSHPHVENWLHFDSLEKDKLEWLRGVEESNIIKPDEPYEARFDFKGYLLPYTVKYSEETKTLFHHGEESHRPGYSFAELFELSRSTITQQRVMALNIIAGVLEYYMAGIYKDIIEIPLSKILFVIRFALDENRIITLEPSLRAMRNLLYNRIDEACLDLMIGFEHGTRQPSLENDKAEISELDSQESDLKDFHLAEIDLVSACLRTDVLQRLYYILHKIRPSFNSVQFALHILTRFARDSVDTALKIVQTDHLMRTIIDNFVPDTNINFHFDPNIVYNRKPILAALKFIRVLSLQSEATSSILVSKYNILNIMSGYINSGVDGTYGLRIQIEAYCILSNLLCFNTGIENTVALLPVIITTLYKHVESTNLKNGLVSTHAAVLIQLINRLLKVSKESVHVYKAKIFPLIRDGLFKWLAQLSACETYTYDNLRLVSSVIDCTKTILLFEQNLNVSELVNTLKLLCESKVFMGIEEQLIISSNLLSGIENKQLHCTKNLVSLKSTVIDSNHKVLPILNNYSPIAFLNSLFSLLYVVNNWDISSGYVKKTFHYLNKIRSQSLSLCDNWFTAIETDFIFCALKILTSQNAIEEENKDSVYAVANKLCYILRVDKKYELQFLFSNIIFNKNWFTADRLMEFLSLSEAEQFSIDDIKSCYSRVVNLNFKESGPSTTLIKWQQPILPRDWIYLPILKFYAETPTRTCARLRIKSNFYREERYAQDALVIVTSLQWIIFNETCYPELLSDINITDRFCRIMCVFLCDLSLFIDSRITPLLSKALQILYKKEKECGFDFDRDLMGLGNFEDFYIQFLEEFEGVSYGDHNFVSCLMVPLAQKHNVKWRKLVWSEYSGCVHVMDCPEHLLCYNINEYLYPEETDESLIKSYSQSLSTPLNAVYFEPMHKTIASKIALHHTKCYYNRINNTK